ncbi:MAG: DNA alkylation repair protein [Cyclobacteriaceae bacterium]|nr:DNA alkylation repair protein [Cyclobacteriaceae bacterium]
MKKDKVKSEKKNELYMSITHILNQLEKCSNPKAIEGMARFGIHAGKIYGLTIPKLREIAKSEGINQQLSLELWAENSRETRILACMTGDSNEVSEQQMEDWVKDFDSWEVCDQCIQNIFEKSKLAISKAIEWSEREEEFVKRAGFVLMARLGMGSKKTEKEVLNEFLSIILKKKDDERNFVKKAINWALRQIGKRDLEFNKKAIEIANIIKESGSVSARWIANDALRELQSEPVQRRLNTKK